MCLGKIESAQGLDLVHSMVQGVAMHAWAAQPLSAGLLGLLILSTFWHARLGMQVMIEDYVHEIANKFAALALLNLAAFAGAAFGLLCVIRLALGA